MDIELKNRQTHFLNFIPRVGDYLKSKQDTRGFDVQKKGTIDIVTEADLHSEKMIIEEIQKEFPKDQILGEETGLIENTGRYKWIIDPLDGTTNYANFLPLYAISIGIEDTSKNEVVFGLIMIPVLNDIYYAIKNEGAFKNKKRIYVSEKTEIVNSLFCTGFPYNLNEKLENLSKKFIHMLSITRGIRRTGSAALDLAWLAEGRFDGFWEENLKPWDTSAGFVLIQEAGGIVSDFLGNPFSILSPSILAGNPHIHRFLVEEFKKFVVLAP